MRWIPAVLPARAGTASLLHAQVVQLADANTRQFRTLDRTRTTVILPGSRLEEHGLYLPAFTDRILSVRLADELATGLARAKLRVGDRAQRVWLCSVPKKTHRVTE